MRLRVLLVAVSVLFLSGPAWAQTDIFGGYSFLSVDFDSGDRETVHGWMANVSGGVADHIGIVGDVSGFYEDGTSVYTYMGGLRYNVGTNGVNPFAQALFGGARIGDSTFSENGTAMGFGGGVDIPIADRVSVRAVQFDWVPVRFVGEWFTNNVRLGWGIVFRIP